MTGSAAGAMMMDSDAAGLVAQVEAHMQALARDAMELLGGAKDRMAALQAAALAAEQDAATRRLEAKQAELDLLGSELAATKGELATTEDHLERVSDAYFCKVQGIRNTRAQLRALYVWREFATRRRRLARLAARADAWYLQRWLLGRAYDRWSGLSRVRYRLLVAARSQQEREADAAALREQHATEVAKLRSGIAALEQQLQQEAAARSEMEEGLQRSFMRGVSAINLEALQIMRTRGPLAAAANTTAAGHQPVQQPQSQQQQGGSSWSVPGSTGASAVAAAAAPPRAPGGIPGTATAVPAAGAEAAGVAAPAPAPAPAAAGFGASLSAWLPPAPAASAPAAVGQASCAPWLSPFASLGIGPGMHALHPAMRHTPAPAASPQPPQQQQEEAATSWGALASTGATMHTGPQAGVFVERSAALSATAAGKAAQQLQQQPSRALQAKRATGQARAF